MNSDGVGSFLVVRLGSLGDIVHTLPAVASLRDTFPAAKIDWVVEKKWAPFLELVTCIDGVIPLERSAVGYLACIRRLRQMRYSCAVDFQGLYKSAVLAWCSGAPRRVGRDWESAREAGAPRLYTDRVRPSGRHIAEMNVSLAVHAGAEEAPVMDFPLRVPVDQRAQVRATLVARKFGEFVVISPGGGWKSKCWPPERYGLLCAELWQKHGLGAVINVGPGEGQLGHVVARNAGAALTMVVSPKLVELAALLAQAKLVVGGDSGPLHLAAALGARTVALFGPTDPERNGPLPRGVVLRNASAHGAADKRGAYQRGRDYSPEMLSLTVGEVLDATESQLGAAA